MHDVWRTIFGTDFPVEVEIGPGTGTFLLSAAERAPCTNFFGLEHSRSRATRLQAAIDARGLNNAKVINADAACIVATMIPSASVAAYHVYFPDPWWKRRHHRRRLFTAEFAAALSRTLIPDGRLYVATDVDEVFALMLSTLAGCGSFSRDLVTHSPRAGLTSFERKGLARGALIHDATFVRADAQTSRAAPITPAESPSAWRRIGVRSSSLNT